MPITISNQIYFPWGVTDTSNSAVQWWAGLGYTEHPPPDKLFTGEHEMESKVKHCGGCHCGQVRFEVWAPKNIDVYDCK